MRTIALVTFAALLGIETASSQNLAASPAKPVPAEAAAAAVISTPVRRNDVATPESRSAAALSLSSEPTFDDGTSQRLKQAVQTYSEIATHGGWPAIPTDAKFAIGVQGAHDDILRKRLIVSGDLAADKATGPFDSAVADALKHFQSRHGLATTGTIGPRALAALNVPAEKRVQQLQASLERVVNMNFKFGERYVVVNIPAAYAEAVENDVVVRRYRVIVGKTDKPSPTVTAEISNVNLNPTWTVPQSITKNEIVAHMRKDRNYLDRLHMQLLDAHQGVIDPATVDWSSEQSPNFTVRQEPGAWNALGSVRIDMPNSYSVYMHDTNQKNLFSDDYRFDSHGCARVDNVRDLAAWLLKDMPRWSRQEIDLVIATGQREDIHLAKRIPVAWTYLTGWVTRDRTVNFRNDVYDQDTQLLEATAEEHAFFNQAGDHPLGAHIVR